MAPASASLRGPPGGQAGSGSVQRASNEPGKATSKPTTIKATVLGGTDDEQLIGFRSNNEDKVARVFKMESVAGKRAPAPSRKAVWVGQTEDGSSQGLVGSLGPHHGQFVVTHQSTCTSGSPGARSASRDCSTAPPDRLEHHPDFARMKKLGSAVHDSVSGLEGGRRIKKELRAVFASAEKQMEEQARGGDNGLRILDALKRGVARCRRKADELLSDPVGCALRKAQDEAAFWEGWAGYLLEKAVMAQSEANVKRWSYERARAYAIRTSARVEEEKADAIKGAEAEAASADEETRERIRVILERCLDEKSWTEEHEWRKARAAEEKSRAATAAAGTARRQADVAAAKAAKARAAAARAQAALDGPEDVDGAVAAVDAEVARLAAREEARIEARARAAAALKKANEKARRKRAAASGEDAEEQAKADAAADYLARMPATPSPAVRPLSLVTLLDFHERRKWIISATRFRLVRLDWRVYHYARPPAVVGPELLVPALVAKAARDLGNERGGYPTPDEVKHFVAASGQPLPRRHLSSGQPRWFQGRPLPPLPQVRLSEIATVIECIVFAHGSHYAIPDPHFKPSTHHKSRTRFLPHLPPGTLKELAALLRQPADQPIPSGIHGFGTDSARPDKCITISFGPSDTCRITLPSAATYLDVQRTLVEFGVEDFRLETSAGRVVCPDDAPPDGALLHVRIRGRGGAPKAASGSQDAPAARSQAQPAVQPLPDLPPRPTIPPTTGLGDAAQDVASIDALLTRPPTGLARSVFVPPGKTQAHEVAVGIVRLFGSYTAFYRFLTAHPAGPRATKRIKESLIRHKLVTAQRFSFASGNLGPHFDAPDESLFSLRVRANPVSAVFTEAPDRHTVAASGDRWWTNITGQTQVVAPAFRRTTDIPQALMEDDVGDVSIIRAMVAPHAVPGAAQRLALGFIATFGSYVSAFHAYRHVRTISTRSPLTAMLKLVDYVKRNGFLDNTDVTGRAAPLYRCLAQPQNQENSRLSLAFDSSPPPGQMPLALTSATAPAPVPAPVPEQASFAAESIPPPLALETFLFRTITILHKKVEEAAAGRAAAALARHYGSASAPEGAAVEEHMLRTGWEALTSDYSRLYAQWMIDQSKTHPLYYLINPLRTAGAFETTDFDRSSDSLSMVFVNGETDLATFLRCFHRFDDAKLAVGYPAFGRTPDLDNPPSGHLPAPRAKIDSNRAAAVADSGAVHLPPTPGSYSTTSVRPAPPRDSEQRRLPSAKHTRLLDERLRQADAHMATGSTPLKAQSPVHPKPTPSAASPAAKRVAIEGEQQPAAATPQRRVAMEVDRGGSAATARKFNYPLGGHVPGLSRDESVRRTLQELPAEKLVRSFYMFVKGLTTMGPEPPAGEAAPVAKDKHGHERPHQRPGLFEARSPPAPRIWTLLSKGAWREGAGGLARPFEAGKQLLISQVRVDKLNEVVSTLPKDGDERRRAWCYIWNLRWTGQMLYFTHDFNPTEHLPYRIPPGAAIDQLPTEQAISLRQIKEPITPRVGGQSTTARRRQIFRPYGWRDFDTLRDLLVTVKAVADNDKERLAVDQLTHLIVAVGTNIDAPNSASFLLKKPRTCFVRCLQDYSVPRQVMVPILYLVEKAGIHMGVEFGGQVEVTHECHLCDDPLSTETAKNARLAVPLTADQALDLHHARNHFWVVADGEVARKVKAAASDLVLWSSENVGPWRGALRARNIDVPTGDGAAILGFRNMSSLMLAPLRAGYDVDWLRSGTWQVLGERIVTSFASKRALSHDARLFPALHDTEAWLKVRQIAQSFDGWFKDSDKITFAAALDTTPLLPITDIPRRPTSAGAGNIAATLGQPSSAGSTEPTKEHVVVESSPGPATASPGPAARSRVAATPDPASPTLSGSPSAQECWTEDGACAACGVSKVLVGKTRHRSFCTEKVRRFVSATMRAGRPSSDYEAKISTTAHGRPVQSAVLDHLRHILVREFEAEAHTEKLRKELGLAMGMFQRHWVGERSYVLDTATVSRMATMVASRLQLGHRESRYQTGAGLTAGGDEFAADRKATAVAMYASVKRDFVPMLMRDERASYEERLLSSDLNSVVGEFIRNAKRLAIWETPKDIRKLIRGQVQNAGALFPTKTQNHVCRTIWESLFDFTVITAYRLELGATILLGKVKLAEAATAPRAAAGGGTEAQGGRASRRKRRTYHEDKDDEAENEAEAAADQAESDLGGAQQPAAQADATAAPRVFSDEQVAAAERIRAGILRCLGGEEIARKVFEELKGIARVQYLPVPPWPLRRVLTEEIVAGLAEGYFERHGYEAAAIAAFGPIATQERGRLQGLTDDQLLNEIADEQAQETIVDKYKDDRAAYEKAYQLAIRGVSDGFRQPRYWYLTTLQKYPEFCEQHRDATELAEKGKIVPRWVPTQKMQRAEEGAQAADGEQPAAEPDQETDEQGDGEEEEDEEEIEDFEEEDAGGDAAGQPQAPDTGGPVGGHAVPAAEGAEGRAAARKRKSKYDIKWNLIHLARHAIVKGLEEVNEERKPALDVYKAQFDEYRKAREERVKQAAEAMPLRSSEGSAAGGGAASSAASNEPRRSQRLSQRVIAGEDGGPVGMGPLVPIETQDAGGGGAFDELRFMELAEERKRGRKARRTVEPAARAAASSSAPPPQLKKNLFEQKWRGDDKPPDSKPIEELPRPKRPLRMIKIPQLTPLASHRFGFYFREVSAISDFLCRLKLDPTRSSSKTAARTAFLADRDFYLGWIFDLSDFSHLLRGCIVRDTPTIMHFNGLQTNGVELRFILTRVEWVPKSKQKKLAEERLREAKKRASGLTAAERKDFDKRKRKLDEELDEEERKEFGRLSDRILSSLPRKLLEFEDLLQEPFILATDPGNKAITTSVAIISKQHFERILEMVKLQLDDPKRPGSKLVPNPFNTAITVIQPNGTRFKYTFSYKYENGLIKSWDLIPSKSLNIEPHVHNGRLYTRQHKYSSDKSPEACVPKPQYLSTPESIKGNCPEEKQRQRRRAPGEIAPCDLSDERCQELFEERRAKFLKVSGKTQEEAEKIWDRLGMLPGAARYELERMCPSDHIRRAKGVPKNNKMREGWRKEAGVLKEACFWDAEKKDYVTRAASVEEWSSKLPTPRTSDPDLFQRHARCMLQTLPGLLAHYGRYRERQLRMTSKRRGDHTMAKMAEVYFAPDVLVRPYDPGGGGGGDVIVASDNTAWISFQSIAGTVLPYGDANFSTSIRGRPPTPNRQLVKSLRRLEEEGRDPRKNQHLAEWRKDLCLSFVREFRTSRMCRECHITVCKQAKGRECGLLQNNKTIWGVKYCELCHVMWSRDINAAFNILWIFLFTILNEGDRPEGFFVEV